MSREVTEFDLRKPEFQDPKLKPEHFEFDADGEVVRKDRFERGMRRVHGILIEQDLASPRDKWTVDSVVENIKSTIAKTQRLKLLLSIINNAPEDAEFYHFENMTYVKNIDREEYQCAKENPKDSPLVGHETKKMGVKDRWIQDGGFLPYIEILVSIDSIKKEINQILGFEMALKGGVHEK